MAFKPVEIKPPKYPTELLNKDWHNRRCTSLAYNTNISKAIELLHDFKVREDDVWIVTLPKCGTTWMQELTWLVVNDFDFESANQKPLETRSPFIEFELSYDLTHALERFDKMESVRVFKTHLPLPLLPAQLWSKKPKTIYVMRDPKDALVSFFHFGQKIGRYQDQTLSEVIEADLAHELETNNIVDHALEFFVLRNELWVYYTSYEKMKTNLKEVISDICVFLEKSITAEQMEQMLKHLSFEEMKQNQNVNHVVEIAKIRKFRNMPVLEDKSVFVRKGRVGSSNEELSTELFDRLNTWIEDSLRAHHLTLKDILLQS